MGHFMKARTLINPARKKRKLSPKQIAIFGTKRQKAALKASRSRKRSNPGLKQYINRKVKRARKSGYKAKAVYYRKRSEARAVRASNPSRILTLSLPNVLGNPSRKKRSKNNMAKSRVHRRRQRTANPKRVYRHKRRATVNPIRHHRRRRNPSTKVVYRYRKHASRMNYRRRNPVRLGGIGKIGGILAGAGVTFFVDKMLPASLTSGFIGYVTTAAVAMLQGKVIGGVIKNRAFGNDMVTGGFIYLAVKVVGDLFPSLGAYLPFSLKGMGIIGASSFYQPQVNMPGSMASFVRPSAIPMMVAAPASLKGINSPYPFSHNQRRTGRLS
jgi:hypothetical protein